MCWHLTWLLLLLSVRAPHVHLLHSRHRVICSPLCPSPWRSTPRFGTTSPLSFVHEPNNVWLCRGSCRRPWDPGPFHQLLPDQLCGIERDADYIWPFRTLYTSLASVGCVLFPASSRRMTLLTPACLICSCHPSTSSAAERYTVPSLAHVHHSFR